MQDEVKGGEEGRSLVASSRRMHGAVPCIHDGAGARIRLDSEVDVAAMRVTQRRDKDEAAQAGALRGESGAQRSRQRGGAEEGSSGLAIALAKGAACAVKVEKRSSSGWWCLRTQ